jgi:hypothetical protein
LNFYQLAQRWNNPSLFTFKYKNEVVKEIIKREKDNDFRVSYIVDPGWQYGFDYLFKLYGRVPKAGPEVKDYIIFLPKEKSAGELDMEFGGIGLVLPRK